MDTLSHAVLLGAWFGMVHAFDADHLATIGGLAVRNGALAAAGYAWRWSLGHAAALGLVAIVVLGLGSPSVLDMARYAELLVCAALFVIGTQALVAARRAAGRRAAPRIDAHVATTAAAHLHFVGPWHTHSRRGAAGVVLGLLHGCAGSAAVLALLPLTQLGSVTASAAYLACFSLGVTLGALLFAKAFATLARRARGNEWLAAALPAAVGIAALAAAGLLLFETINGRG